MKKFVAYDQRGTVIGVLESAGSREQVITAARRQYPGVDHVREWGGITPPRGGTVSGGKLVELRESSRGSEGEPFDEAAALRESVALYEAIGMSHEKAVAAACAGEPRLRALLEGAEATGAKTEVERLQDEAYELYRKAGMSEAAARAVVGK